jgi:non-heme chloroperoxidase
MPVRFGLRIVLNPAGREARARREDVDMAHTIKVVELPNWVKLPYAELGDASGVPLVLLHGYADSWHSFELLLPHLPEWIRTFALTQRGHGDASRPGAGYRPRDSAADLAAFMDALHLGAAIIAGGSSGGFVARRFAMDHPERTLGLVLIGSPATLQGKPGVRELWDSTVSKLEDPIDPAFIREFQESTLTQPVPTAFLEEVVQESLKVPARVWKATLEGLMEEDFPGELDRIQAPTLIIWGDQDAIVPRSDQEALLEAIAGSRLEVCPGAGHALYWEQPERVASGLVAFVKDLVN